MACEHYALDEKFPEWGEGPYYSVTLTGTHRLRDLLNHIYVLVPVLDAEKHYWIGKAEVEKLLRKGEGWLASHPNKEAIVKRYLAAAEQNSEQETKMEEPIRLWQQGNWRARRWRSWRRRTIPIRMRLGRRCRDAAREDRNWRTRQFL